MDQRHKELRPLVQGTTSNMPHPRGGASRGRRTRQLPCHRDRPALGSGVPERRHSRRSVTEAELTHADSHGGAALPAWLPPDRLRPSLEGGVSFSREAGKCRDNGDNRGL